MTPTPTPRADLVQRILAEQLSAILRTTDQDLARGAMRAAVAGGFRMIEFTLTTPGALELIQEFRQNEDLLVGAGTVLTTQQVDQAVAAGAQFIVSPVVDAEVISRAQEHAVPSIPGSATPTEMFEAQRLGADFVKLFPAPANIIEFIVSVLGPLPKLRIFPTAGVDEQNCREVLRAGAVGAGFVRSLFTPEDLHARDFESIKQRAQRILAVLRADQ